MLKSRDALAMFGVCSSATGDPVQLAAQMNAVGFTLLRCACETQAHLDFLLAVQKLVPGFRFNWLITAYNNNPATDQSQFSLAAKAKAAGLNVVFVEAANEINNPDTGGGSHYPGSTQRIDNNNPDDVKQAILAWVTDIYNWFSVNWPSVIRMGSTALAYDAAAWAALEPVDTKFIQYPVVHCYPPPGKQPSNLDAGGDGGPDGAPGDQFHMVVWAERAQTGGAMNAPVALTETGCPGGPVIQPGRVMDYRTQAMTMLNIACDAMAQGLGLCIFYCMGDPGADPGNNGGPEPHFGFFNNDGSTKPVAPVIKRMFDTFRAGGGVVDFTAKQLLVSVSGLGGSMGAAGCMAVIARPDGSYVVPVWNEPPIHDGTNPITPQTINAAVSWGSDLNYSVIDSLTGQQVKFGNGAGVTVPLNGYPQYVVLTPKSSGTATTGTIGNASPVVTGPVTPVTAPIVAGADHSLTIKLLQALQAGTYTLVPAAPATVQALSIGLSEDAYKGDCLVNVSLDGMPMLTSLPVVQLRSSNGFQSVPLGQVDTTKPHTVVISFLNDMYAGTADTDRNLYITNYTLGDKTVTVGGSQLGSGDYTLAIPAG